MGPAGAGAGTSLTIRSASIFMAQARPLSYRFMLFVVEAIVMMPVCSSITAAKASISAPVMSGTGVHKMTMNFGEKSRAADTTSWTNLSSLPMMASISVTPDMKMRLSWSYQRGSSWVAYVELQPDGS